MNILRASVKMQVYRNKYLMLFQSGNNNVSSFNICRYEKSSRYGRMGFEEEFMHYLGNIQADVDRKIRRGHDRLIMNQAREQVCGRLLFCVVVIMLFCSFIMLVPNIMAKGLIL